MGRATMGRLSNLLHMLYEIVELMISEIHFPPKVENHSVNSEIVHYANMHERITLVVKWLF